MEVACRMTVMLSVICIKIADDDELLVVVPHDVAMAICHHTWILHSGDRTWLAAVGMKVWVGLEGTREP